MEKKQYEVHLEVTRLERHAIFRCTRRRPPLKNEKMVRKSIEKMHTKSTSVTRLERHAIFRRSTFLDDVDCFDTLKSQTYQWHDFTTLLFQGLRDPFKAVLQRASCQNRFLYDVIERKRTPILSCCHLATITMRLRTVSGPSCDTAESVIFEGRLL